MFGQNFVVSFNSLCRSKWFNPLFRMRGLHLDQQTNKNTVAKCKQLFHQAYPNSTLKIFPGVSMDKLELKRLIQLFRITLIIYVLSDAWGSNQKLAFSFTHPNSYTEINLLHHGGIYSLVTNPDKFIGIHEWTDCSKGFLSFAKLYHHKRKHHNNKISATKIQSTRGGYNFQAGLKNKKNSEGAPEKYAKTTVYPYFAVYDIESSLEPMI